MPGAGKSTLGVLLAKALGKAFIDTDIIIQQKKGMKLYEIINSLGINEFLTIEEECLLDLQEDNSVVATGGSVVYRNRAIEHLKRKGKIVYLKLSYEVIEKRLSDITTRGVAIEKGTTLKDLYNERVPLYESYADLIVECDNLSMEKTIDYIIDRLKN